MISIRPTDPGQVKEAWAGHRRKERDAQAKQPPPPRPRNVRAILDLGTLTYFTFRGRMYGVPPLPWRQGQLLMDAYLELRGFGEEITEKNHKQYYACIARMAKIIWKNTRMVGRFMRTMKKLRLLRNPFERANDNELLEVAVFYLRLRTTRTGGFKPGPEPRQHRTS